MKCTLYSVLAQGGVMCVCVCVWGFLGMWSFVCVQVCIWMRVYLHHCACLCLRALCALLTCNCASTSMCARVFRRACMSMCEGALGEETSVCAFVHHHLPVITSLLSTGLHAERIRKRSTSGRSGASLQRCVMVSRSFQAILRLTSCSVFSGLWVRQMKHLGQVSINYLTSSRRFLSGRPRPYSSWRTRGRPTSRGGWSCIGGGVRIGCGGLLLGSRHAHYGHGPRSPSSGFSTSP